MLILGIDPGLNGAFALRDTDRRSVITAFPMPVFEVKKGKGTARQIAWGTLVDEPLAVDYVFVERVQSSPQMGVTSAFNFGRGYGGLEAYIACQKWPVEYVTPVSWKKALKVPASKDDAIHRASLMMPADAHWWTVKHAKLNKQQASGVAEAALIALYGEMWLGERGLLAQRQRRRIAQ